MVIGRFGRRNVILLVAVALVLHQISRQLELPPTASSAGAARKEPEFFVHPNQAGSWIGNHWIPPPYWRLRNATELQTIFRHRSVLFIGDSTARRTAATLYHILWEPRKGYQTYADLSSPEVIDINKHEVVDPCETKPFSDYNHTVFCRQMPGGSGHFVMTGVACLHEIDKVLKYWPDWRQHFDLVVLGAGIWECTLRGREHCKTNETKLEKFDRIVQKLPVEDVDVVWRTTGYSAFPKARKAVDDLNAHVIGRIHQMSHPNLTYIDWGAAVYDRSFGENRIAGDIDAHYGLEPRLVAIQMLANHMIEKGGEL